MIESMDIAHQHIRHLIDCLDMKGPDISRYLSRDEFKALERLINECDILVQAFGPQLEEDMGVDPEV